MKLKIALFYFSIFFMPGCHKYSHQKELALLLGIKKAEILNEDSRDEFAGFGKGYSITLFDLDQATLQAFLNAPLQPLPNKSDTIRWKSQGWQQSPLDTIYNEIYFRALNYEGGYSGIKKWENAIKAALKKDRFRYGFYYYPDLQNVRSSQLYIYDLSINRLYIITSDF